MRGIVPQTHIAGKAITAAFDDAGRFHDGDAKCRTEPAQHLGQKRLTAIADGICARHVSVDFRQRTADMPSLRSDAHRRYLILDELAC